jgi:hypothetical protein
MSILNKVFLAGVLWFAGNGFFPQELRGDEAPPHLYAVGIFDAEAEDIRPGVLKDVKTMVGFFRKIFFNKAFPRYYKRASLHLMGVKANSPANAMEWERVTRTAVLTYISGMKAKVSRKDPVLIYYSGHGGFSATGAPVLRPVGDEITHADILTLLKATGTKHSMLVADVPSSLTGFEEGILVEGAPKPTSQWLHLEDLFFRHSGVTQIVSAQLSQKAWTTKSYGGLFTFQFFDTLGNDAFDSDSNNNGFHEWSEAFQSINAGVQNAFAEQTEKSEVGAAVRTAKDQSPLMIVNATPDRE